MNTEFQSRWANQLAAFVRFKNALGFPYVRSIATLRSFDQCAASRDWKGSRDLAAITRAWLNRSAQRKPVTVTNELGVLRQFCRFRQRYEAQAFVPDRTWAPQSTESIFTPHVFSETEVRRIVAATVRINASPRSRRCYRLLVLVLYCTGLRVGEALGLRRCDLDLKQVCFRAGPSKGRIRWVPFHRDLARELRRWLADDCSDLSPDAFVFADDHGRQRRVKNVSHNLRVLFRRCRLKPESGRAGPRCHDLRHTMAVHRLERWYREGHDPQHLLPWLSAYLGHRNLLGTECYLHATPELLATASRRLRRQLAPTPNLP
jgi:integrase